MTISEKFKSLNKMEETIKEKTPKKEKSVITEEHVVNVLKFVGFKEANGYLTLSRTAVKPMKRYYASEILKEINK